MNSDRIRTFQEHSLDASVGCTDPTGSSRPSSPGRICRKFLRNLDLCRSWLCTKCTYVASCRRSSRTNPGQPDRRFRFSIVCLRCFRETLPTPFVEAARQAREHHEGSNPHHVVAIERRAWPLLLALILAGLLPPVWAEAYSDEPEQGTQPAQTEQEKPPLEGPPAPAEPQKKEESRLFRTLGIAVYGASAGDVVSTELLLARGGVENNPLMENRAVRISAHVAAPIALNWVSERFYQKHPKVAVAMRIIGIAVWGYATVDNLRTWRRLSGQP